jgi:hypothetical protein
MRRSISATWINAVVACGQQPFAIGAKRYRGCEAPGDEPHHFVAGDGEYAGRIVRAGRGQVPAVRTEHQRNDTQLAIGPYKLGSTFEHTDLAPTIAHGYQLSIRAECQSEDGRWCARIRCFLAVHL